MATFQGEANTQAGLVFVFFSVSVFTTGLVTDIYPPSPLLGVYSCRVLLFERSNPFAEMDLENVIYIIFILTTGGTGVRYSSSAVDEHGHS